MLHLDANTNYKNEQHLDTRSRCCIQMLHLDDALSTQMNIALVYIFFFMQAISVRGLKRSLQTDYILKVVSLIQLVPS